MDKFKARLDYFLANPFLVGCLLWGVLFVWWSHFRLGMLFLRGETGEDLLRYAYSLERMSRGSLPLWNPWVDGGQPYTIWLLLTEFPSPLDGLLALVLGLFSGLNPVQATGLVLVTYAALFWLFCYRISLFLGAYLFGVHSGHFRKLALFTSLAQVTAVFRFGGMGTNVVYLQIFFLIPPALYYFLRFTSREGQPRDLVWFMVIFGLLPYTAGSYIIPIALFILTIGLLSLPGLVRRYQENRKRLRELWPLLGVPIFLGPAASVYSAEFPRIWRAGRDMVNPTFEALVYGQSAPTVSLFMRLFRGSIDNPCTWLLLLIPFGFLVLFRKEILQRHLGLWGTFWALSTVCLGAYSPFYRVYYDWLFPFLQQVRYTDIYFDLTAFLVLQLAATGIWLFWQRPFWSDLVIGAGAIYLTMDQFEMLGLNFEQAVGLSGLGITMLVARRAGGYRAGLSLGTAGLLALGAGGQIWPTQTNFIGFYFSRDQEHFFGESVDPPKSRVNRVKLDREKWGAGFPIWYHEVIYDPGSNFLRINDTQSLDQTLNPASREQVFALGQPWLKLSDTVSVDLNQTGSQEEPNLGEIKILSYEPESLKLLVTSDSARFLRWADAFHPDWQATLNGKPAPILRSNQIFKAIQVPQGKSEITFEFKPMFANWYRLAVLTWAGMLVIGIRSKRR